MQWMVINSNARSRGDLPSRPLPQLQHAIDLATFASVLIEAGKHDRAWIRDLGDEQIFVSADLFQVIQAARLFRRAA
jgi:hypothetical protein